MTTHLLTLETQLISLWQQGLELWLSDTTDQSASPQPQLGFKAPKSLLQGENLSFLKSNKADIITLLMGKPSDYLRGYVLTPGQQSILLDELLRSDQDQENKALSKFNLYCTANLDAKLCQPDLDTAIKATLAELFDTHISLSLRFMKTGFDTSTFSNAASLQFKQQPSHSAFNINDYYHRASFNSVEQANDLAQAFAQGDFVLTATQDDQAEPLFQLLHLSDENNTANQKLCFKAHHLICDFIGFENLIRAFTQLLSGKLGLKNSAQTSTDVFDSKQFAIDAHQAHNSPANDYTEFLHTLDAQEKQDDYFPYLLNSFVDTDSQAMQSSDPIETVSTELIFDQEQLLAILQAAKQEHCTPFIYLLSCLQLTLLQSTFSKQTAITVALANRPSSSALHTIGHFANPLPLIQQHSHTQSFKALLKSNGEHLTHLLKHQGISGDAFLAKRADLRQIAFSYNKNTHDYTDVFSQLNDAAQTGHPFNLSVIAVQEATQLKLVLSASPEKFNSFALENFATRFALVIKTALKQDSSTAFIAQQHVLAPYEQHVIRNANLAKSAYFNENTFQNLYANFDFASTRRSHLTAVKVGEHSISFNTLRHLSDSLCEQLCEHAQALESHALVAIDISRSEYYIAAVLAILKAGASYLPIDPSLPDARKETMLSLTSCPLRISMNTHNEFTVHPTHIARSPNITPIKQQNWQSDYPYHTACILFTSGSTGLPKPLPISHQAIVRIAKNNGFLDFKPEDSFLFSANLSFDAVNLEIWTALLNEGCVIPVDQETLLTPSKLAQLISHEKPDHLFFTTALFNQLIDVKPDLFKDVSTLMFGGENCDTQKVKQCMQAGKPTHLLHCYGPTENGTFSTTFEVNQVTDLLSIGQPVNNSEAFILNQFDQLAGIGTVGELCVAGDAVSTAYLNTADSAFNEKLSVLNTEKFIAQNLPALLFASGDVQSDKSQLIYKTGDLAIQDTQGNFYCLGRTDDQIKIRGFRVQLSEIENAITHTGLVDASKLIAIKDETQRVKSLCAYVVSPEHAGKSEETLTAQLRKTLAKSLPQYMQPKHIVVMEKFPLNSNGKIDKKQLPEPGESTPEQSNLNPNALSDSQQVLLDCFTQLKLFPATTDDSFLQLGGDSLSAFQLSAAIDKHFNKTVSASQILQSGSIAHLDALILGNSQALANTAEHSSLPPLNNLFDMTQQQVPASLSQQRLWFMQELMPQSNAYHMPCALFLENISPEKLDAALTHLLEHLWFGQSTIIDNDGAASIALNTHNISINHSDIDICFTDDANIPESTLTANTQITLKSSIKAFFSQSFDLKKSLYHFDIIRVDNGCILLANIHHIAIDGQSVIALFEALSTQLNDSSENALNIANNKQDYFDFCLWQQQVFEQGHLAGQLDYWQETLTDAESYLPLPTDFSRPAIFTHKGDVQSFEFSTDLSANIDSLCKSLEITPFMFFAAAYQLTLSIYANQENVSIGFPSNARTHARNIDTIGLFVNNLVLNQTMGAQQTIHQLLSQTKQLTLAAFNHQDMPFDILLDHLGVEKSRSYTPFLQASFSYEALNEHQLISQAFERNAINCSVLDTQWQIAKYDLHLSCFARSASADQTFQAQLEFNADLFKAETIARFIDSFTHIASTLCTSSPETNLGQISALSSHDAAFLKQANATDTHYDYAQVLNLSQWAESSSESALTLTSTPEYLHQLFEAQVKANGAAIAVEDEHQALSFDALNRKANQLAHFLLDKTDTHLGGNNAIAVLLDRSVNMSIALLAILKTGNAYLPLLTDTPQERISFILTQSECRTILTQAVDSAMSDAITQVDINTDLHAYAQDNIAIAETKIGLNAKISSSDQALPLFNLIYTSGSTGKPKGVGVTQLGIINRLVWMQSAYPITTNDTVLQKTPYNFDVSVWELFWPLITGSKLYFAKPAGHKDSQYLCQVIQAQGISTLHFVPSMLNIFNQESAISQCTSLKQVFTSGEALQINHADEFLQQLPNTALHNLYGPTEASIDVSYYPCHYQDTHNSIPIGKPISNIKLYVLDSQLNVLPIGAAGDLYISGIGLAQGYIDLADTNRESFISNPHDTQAPHHRLYKTGDIARWLDDGNIEYLGRSDNQIKLRGLRIELGEIESSLLSIEHMLESAVIKHDATESLIAFYVAKQSIDANTIKQALASLLPAYMLPTRSIQFEAMPLSANGKLDRKALSKLADQASFNAETYEYVAPRNDTESVIINLIQSLLSLDKVGIHDNFFEIGGHSLLATQLASRIRDHFDCEFELKTVFDHPTAEGLSLAVIENTLDDIDLDDDLLDLLNDLE